MIIQNKPSDQVHSLFRPRVTQIVLQLAAVHVLEDNEDRLLIGATAQQPDDVHVRLQRFHHLQLRVEVLDFDVAGVLF